MYSPILATLGYILSPDGKQVLMIHRNKRPDDIHYGKYNGLGGRIEPNEDIVSGMRREIFEESGLTAERMTLRGTISWPGFGKQGQDWFGFIFRIESWHGELHEGNLEGTLAWVPSLRCWHYRSGRAMPSSCRWSLTTILANFTAICLTTTGKWSVGATCGSSRHRR